MVYMKTGALAGMAMMLLGCGGSDDAGGFSTSVDSGKKLDQLSAAESAQLCKDFEAWGQDVEKTFKPKLCKLAGLFTQSKSECEMAVKECIDAPAEPSEGGMCMQPENCSASIGDVQKCLNDSVAMIEGMLDKLPSCGSDSGTIPTKQPEPPASCKKIETTCPDIAGMFDEVELDGGDEDQDESGL